LDLLLDTHALLWWLAGDTSLSVPARDAIGDPGNNVFVSAASAWEIATKFRIGKLPGAGSVISELADVVEAQGFVTLPISFAHGQMAGALPGPHRDPFDRMLVAQAIAHGAAVVTPDPLVAQYPIRVIW